MGSWQILENETKLSLLLSYLSASLNSKSKLRLQHEVTARWSESLVRDSLIGIVDAISIFVVIFLFCFSLPFLLDVPFYFLFF